MPLKPPRHPEPLKAGLERFGVYGTRWAALAVIAVVAFWPSRSERKAAVEAGEAIVPSQEWTIDSTPQVLAFALPGALPRPAATQKRPPCATKIGEEEHGGYCWLRLDVSPPCPQEVDAYAWEHNGKCFQRVLRAARPPTTGEPQPSNVAGGAE